MGFTFSENEIKFYNDNGELCCFECGSTEEIQMHHIVPKSRGGEKVISICYSCHQKAHHKKAKSVNHRQLVSERIAKARAKGVKWNAFSKSARKKGRSAWAEKSKAKRAELGPMLHALKEQGFTYKEIADKMNSLGTTTPRGRRWAYHTAFHTHSTWKKDQNSS